MKKFSDFGIKPLTKNFTGDKIKIDRILNKQIIVVDYRIQNSKFEKGHGKRLDLQIAIDGANRVVFTSSSVLMELIQQVPKENFPFTTTIVRDNERFEFT